MVRLDNLPRAPITKTIYGSCESSTRARQRTLFVFKSLRVLAVLRDRNIEQNRMRRFY